MSDAPISLSPDDAAETPYARCRAYVARRQSVAPKDLAKDLGLAPSVARAYLASLEAEGLLGPANEIQRRLVIGTPLAAPDADPYPGRTATLGPDQVAELSDRMTPTAGARLRAVVDRIETIEAEQLAAAADKREVYAQAQGEGFDLKALKRLIAIRKLDPERHAQTEFLVEQYQAQLEPRLKVTVEVVPATPPDGTVH